MDDEKQSGFNFDFSNVICHFIADAARFIGIQRFMIQLPAKSLRVDAVDLSIPWNQRNDIAASSLDPSTSLTVRAASNGGTSVRDGRTGRRKV